MSLLRRPVPLAFLWSLVIDLLPSFYQLLDLVRMVVDLLLFISAFAGNKELVSCLAIGGAAVQGAWSDQVLGTL